MPATSDEVLALAEEARDRLLECSITLTEAKKYAEGDRGTGSFFAAVFGGPLKYFKLNKASKQLEVAKRALRTLRERVDDIQLREPELQLSDGALLLDVVGGGLVNDLAELRIANQVATAVLEVNSVLDEVGLLCTRLRAAGGS